MSLSTKRKANNEQLDHAEEAKVETLDQRERASTNKIALNDGGAYFASCSSETAEEEDAHETPCAAEKGLVTKLTCDVCNPVHLKHLRKQRLKKDSAAPPPPKENSDFIRRGRKFSFRNFGFNKRIKVSKCHTSSRQRGDHFLRRPFPLGPSSSSSKRNMELSSLTAACFFSALSALLK